jgi:anti-sigma B factor antagonist
MKVTGEERCGVNVVHLGAKVVLDLSGVTYVSSAGLGDLVRVTALANTRQARVSLAGLVPFVDGVLKATRLDRFFDIAPDVDVAINRLTSAK